MPKQIRSLVRPEGEVEVALHEIVMPVPADDEVVVQIEAAPINPSDFNIVFARASLDSAKATGTPALPAITAKVPTAALPSLTARLGKAIPVGNEGAGTVVAAGSTASARALLGKRVAIYGGGTYATHRVAKAAACLVLPEGITAADGASNFVNPMTALAMLVSLRQGGHSALVHTAAASNLGQMLVKLCAEEGVPLVNVVRRAEQAETLRGLGSTHVCDSSTATFQADLTEAIAATGATIAFDATGGGKLAGQILEAMESAASRDAKSYSPYGSTTPKHVFIYGGLDRRPTELSRAFGMTWSVSGWLVSNVLATLPPAEVGAMRARVARGLGTTFASQYAAEIGLRDVVDLATVARFAKQATGEKFLVVPTRDVD